MGQKGTPSDPNFALKKYIADMVAPIAATSGPELVADPVKEEVLRKLLTLYVNIFVDSGSYKNLPQHELPVVIAGLALQTIWMLDYNNIEFVKLQDGQDTPTGKMPPMPWDVQDKE